MQTKAVLLFVFVLFFIHVFAQSNDHMFPAADAAKKYIDFDNKGFIINGKRTFLVSAGMEYARVPRALWKDRLQRLKNAGFNCIEIYTFWNYHEPQEGKFNFSGDHDLNAFLQLVHQMGMYCIPRVGPYYCAEWDFGGYPIWIRFKEGLKVREPNSVFQKCVDNFFDTLMPIVCKNQINKGGSVILVQLENEHPLGWGTYMPNAYFEHLKSYALQKGLQVPYFFSGVHHSSDPAGRDYKLDDAARPNPWFSTEFWSVWYNLYNSTEKDAETYARRTWKVIAGGGGGYNYYMAHGGTNFAYTNNDEDAASYDYGAAVGQAGDLRPVYFAMKEAALFAKIFEDVLANGSKAADKYASLLNDTNIVLSARSSNAGDIVCLDNRKKEEHTVEVLGKEITLSAGEIYPLVHQYKLTSDITIDWSYSRIYALAKQGKTINVIVSGGEGDDAQIDFASNKNAVTQTKDAAFSKAPSALHFKAKIGKDDEPSVYSFTCNGNMVRIICLTKKEADKTWFISKGKETYIVSGPAYVSDVNVGANNIAINAEQPWQMSAATAWLFTEKKTTKLNLASSNNQHISSLSLQPWQYKSGSEPASVKFDDSHWFQGSNPPQMGADGDTTADAWYRTIITVPEDNKYTLQVDGGGRATAFVDGKKAGTWNVQDELTMSLMKGLHTFSVFVAHDGRDKFFSYLGAVDSTAAKGLFGDAKLIKGDKAMQDIGDWKYVLADGKDAVNKGIPADDANWKPYQIGEDVFDKKKGYAWFQSPLQLGNYKGGKAILFFKSVDENATVFINNKQVAKHEGWNQKFYITLDHLDTIKGPVNLNVFIENYDNEGGIDQPVTLNLVPDDMIYIKNWKMKGGTGNELSNTWLELADTSQKEGPAFYKSSFMLDASFLQGAIWRIATTGLGHGSVWVNGHNLGRYPEKIPAPGMYVPECWLQKGKNNIVVYDEDGKTPTEVKVETEAAASRDLVLYTEEKNK